MICKLDLDEDIDDTDADEENFVISTPEVWQSVDKIRKTKIYRPEHLLVHVRVKVQLIESSHLLQICATLGKRFRENYKRFF